MSTSGSTILKINNPLLPKKKSTTLVALKEEKVAIPAKEEEKYDCSDKVVHEIKPIVAVSEIIAFDRFETVSPHPYYSMGRYVVLSLNNK